MTSARRHAPEAVGARLCHVRLTSKAPAQSGNFFSEQFGLSAVSSLHQSVFGFGDRAHSLAFSTEPGDRVGLELGSVEMLELVAEQLAQAGLPANAMSDAACASRFCKAGIETCDASGNIVEFIIRPGHIGSPPSVDRCGGLTRLRSIALRSTNIEKDCLIWTTLFGAVVADRVGEILYLSLDDGHHRIVLYPSVERGALYVGVGVATFDQLMQAYYALQTRQVEIVQGPGREVVSGHYFLRFRTPEGSIVSLVFGEDGAAKGAARQFLAHPSSLCSLGSICAGVPELSFSESTTSARRRAPS
ncbi:MAG: VOC family protein [Caulobacterales bacterium]